MLNLDLSFLKSLHAVIDDYTSAKAQVYKCILFSSLCPIPTYFCILRFSHEVFSAGLVLSLIAGTKTLAFHAEVIFKNHKIFWETCYDKPAWRSCYTSWASWHLLLHGNHWKTLLHPEISPRIPPSQQIDHPHVAAIFHFFILPDFSYIYFSEQHTSFPLSFSVHFYFLSLCQFAFWIKLVTSFSTITLPRFHFP